MQILVLSDSHGDARAACEAVERTKPQMIFFLGDGWTDSEVVRQTFPDTPLFRVPGNCDTRIQKPSKRLIDIEGFHILLCHGHTYRVKDGLSEAKEVAKLENLDGFLFGHTHSPLVRRYGKTLFFNPGSIGMGFPPTYGILTAERGKQLDGRVFRLR